MSNPLQSRICRRLRRTHISEDLSNGSKIWQKNQPMGSIHYNFARKQVGDTQKRGNPTCAVHAEIHSICSDRPRPSPAAGLQVSPTSDTCKSVAILMNRRHYNRVGLIVLFRYQRGACSLQMLQVPFLPLS